MKVVFAADIHLSKDENQSFDVFEEILTLCDSKNIENLILGGDTFDSYNDLLFLLERFNRATSSANIKKVFFLPGNHEVKGDKNKEFGKLIFDSKIEVIFSLPFGIERLGNYEFFFIPFQKDISGLFKAEIPNKSNKRIVVGHGSLIDFNFASEDEDCFYDDELFNYLEADIVLLGHIHKRLKKGNIYYPGSARVWRSGEEGKHGVLIVDLENLEVEFYPLETGKEFSFVDVEVDDENFKILNMPEEINNNQWFKIRMYGTVTNRAFIESLTKKISEKFKNSFRVEFDESEIVDVSKYYENSLYKIFTEKWKSHYENLSEENEKEIYRLARKYFLEELSKSVLEKEND